MSVKADIEKPVIEGRKFGAKGSIRPIVILGRNNDGLRVHYRLWGGPASPTHQSIVVYEGAMPSSINKNKGKIIDEWIKDHSDQTEDEIDIFAKQNFIKGAIYTVALYIGHSNETKWALGDFAVFYG